MTTLTAHMFDFRYIWLASSAADLGELSDVELIARDPVLRIVGVLFLLLGLLCDAWLLARYFSHRRAPPADRVSPKPWGSLELWFGIALYFAANALLQLLVLALRIHSDSLWIALLAGNVLVNVFLLLLLHVFFRWRRLTWRTAFGTDTPGPIHPVLAGVIGYFAVIPPLALITQLSQIICRLLEIPIAPQPIADLLARSDSLAVVGLIVALAIVVAPLFEEILFRGFAYPVLKQRWGTTRALLFVSLLFAAIHLHAPAAGALFVLGLALGIAYEKTGSLVAPITMHALFNSANVVVLLHLRAPT